MIYSAQFDGMPDAVRERVYQRLYDVLTGKDKSQTFAGISTRRPAGSPGDRSEHKNEAPDVLDCSSLASASNNRMNEFVILIGVPPEQLQYQYFGRYAR